MCGAHEGCITISFTISTPELVTVAVLCGIPSSDSATLVKLKLVVDSRRSQKERVQVEGAQLAVDCRR